MNASGGPGESRTPDTRFRKPLLYPSELQARRWKTIDFISNSERFAKDLKDRESCRQCCKESGAITHIFLAARLDFAYYSLVLIGSRIVLLNQEKKSMTKRILMASVALCLALALGVIAFAQEPRVDVGERHGNMRAAQQLIQQAWQKVDEAQKDNHYNLGGHAGRAKELLVQASQEIKQSAEAANEHR